MIAKMPYQDLTYAIRKMRGQIIEGIPYAQENFPALSTPIKVWDYLKPRLRYKNDPKGVELFQTLPTLLDDNFHGLTGAGDCDCFTIAALSTLLANGMTDCGIVLAGRSPLNAVHIWAYCNDKGKHYDLDFTQMRFNTTRKGSGKGQYSYTQEIPFILTNKEKKMLLQLAEGEAVLTNYGDHRYIWMPSKGVKVHEQVFDGMSAPEFQRMCLSEGMPLEELEELSGRRAERRHDRQDNKDAGQLSPRQQRKLQKKALKPRNIRKAARGEAKNEKIRNKGQAAIMNARAKQIKAAIPRGSGFNFPQQRPAGPYDGPGAEQDQYASPAPDDQASVYAYSPDGEPDVMEVPDDQIVDDTQDSEEDPQMEEGAGGLLTGLLSCAAIAFVSGKFLEGHRR